jgi:iron complex outermembrane receptor protein
MPGRNTRQLYLTMLPIAFLSAAAHAQTADPQLPQITIIGASPLLGSGVDRDTVPAETNVLRRDDLTRGGTTPPDAVRALN